MFAVRCSSAAVLGLCHSLGSIFTKHEMRRLVQGCGMTHRRLHVIGVIDRELHVGGEGAGLADLDHAQRCDLRHTGSASLSRSYLGATIRSDGRRHSVWMCCGRATLSPHAAAQPMALPVTVQATAQVTK